MDKRNVLVLGVKRYSFQDSDKRQVEGTKVHYVDLAGQDDKDTTGVIPASLNLDYGAYSDFSKLPAIYELDFGIQIRNGKPIVKVTGIQYVSQAEIIS